MLGIVNILHSGHWVAFIIIITTTIILDDFYIVDQGGNDPGLGKS